MVSKSLSLLKTALFQNDIGYKNFQKSNFLKTRKKNIASKYSSRVPIDGIEKLGNGHFILENDYSIKYEN